MKVWTPIRENNNTLRREKGNDVIYKMNKLPLHKHKEGEPHQKSIKLGLIDMSNKYVF